MNKTLVFAIFDFDRFSKHDQIGEVKVPLCQIDLAQTIEEWRELQSVEGEGGQVISQLIYSFLSVVFYDSPVNASKIYLLDLRYKKKQYQISYLHPVRTIGCLHRFMHLSTFIITFDYFYYIIVNMIWNMELIQSSDQLPNHNHYGAPSKEDPNVRSTRIRQLIFFLQIF